MFNQGPVLQPRADQAAALPGTAQVSIRGESRHVQGHARRQELDLQGHRLGSGDALDGAHGRHAAQGASRGCVGVPHGLRDVIVVLDLRSRHQGYDRGSQVHLLGEFAAVLDGQGPPGGAQAHRIRG